MGRGRRQVDLRLIAHIPWEVIRQHRAVQRTMLRRRLCARPSFDYAFLVLLSELVADAGARAITLEDRLLLRVHHRRVARLLITPFRLHLHLSQLGQRIHNSFAFLRELRQLFAFFKHCLQHGAVRLDYGLSAFFFLQAAFALTVDAERPIHIAVLFVVAKAFSVLRITLNKVLEGKRALRVDLHAAFVGQVLQLLHRLVAAA